MLADIVADGFPNTELCILPEDAYYCDQSHLDFEQRLLTNYDHPDAIEHELLASHLAQLRQGEAIEQPEYDFCAHTRLPSTRRVEPAPVVIVEGILLFTLAALREQFDLRVFVDTPLDICLIRRLRRDIEHRGRDTESVLSQYERTVRTMYYAYVQPSKVHANLIIPWMETNHTAVNVLKTQIRSALM